MQAGDPLLHISEPTLLTAATWCGLLMACSTTHTQGLPLTLTISTHPLTLTLTQSLT